MSYQVWPYDSPKQPQSSQFIGLSNQGATCYMNSLLQTLYMTPEFRDLLYKWRYDPQNHNKEEDSIPLQLQMLFGKLQMSNLPYVETTKLTKSFGWDIEEAFQQQDVQEFCRVLFDAIEQSVENTPQENMINDLYLGEMVDYVQCQNCGYESKRTDKFLDISLTVRNEFDNIQNESIEQALCNYVKPEQLTEGNQYFCEQCQEKQDALKGMKFSKLPYILSLQLNRFTLDYETFERIKLNDRVSFPLILNMNPFFKQEVIEFARQGSAQPQFEGQEEQEILPTCIQPKDIDYKSVQQVVETELKPTLEDKDKDSLAMDLVLQEIVNTRESQKRALERLEKIEKYFDEGEYVYELFSIMIHAGSATGGHYYAYIKNFEDNLWYNFNDSYVSKIKESDICKMFGDGNNGQSQSFFDDTYGASAYLLMYRKVVTNNLISVPKEAIPDYIQDSIQKDIDKEQQLYQKQIEQFNNMYVRVYTDDQNMNLNIGKDAKIEDLKKMVLEKFDLDIKLDNCRLRAYNTMNCTMQDVYCDQLTLQDQNISNYKTLKLETKQDEEEFQEYDPTKITIRVYPWHQEYEESNESITIKCTDVINFYIKHQITIKDLIDQLSERFSIPFKRLKVMKKSQMINNNFAETLSLCAYHGYTLQSMRVFDGSTILIEEMDDIMARGKWQSELDREGRRFNLKFNDPNDVTSTYPKFNHSLVFDSQSTLEALKQVIGEKFDLQPDEFIIKRGSQQSPELKDLKRTLQSLNLMNNTFLFIEKGAPTNPDQYRIYFMYGILGLTEEDAGCYKFYELFELPVDANILIEDLKELVKQQIEKCYPTMIIDTNYMRLREKQSDRAGKCMNNKYYLKNYTLYEKKPIVVQMMDQPVKKIKFNQIINPVKRWWPSTWEVSSPIELITDKNWRFIDLGEQLSKLFDIPIENLQVCKITNSYNFTRLDLPSERFYDTFNNYNQLSMSPWYMQSDGNILFVKDKTEEVRSLSAQEQAKYRQNSDSDFFYDVLDFSRKPISFPRQRQKEASVKINVKKNTEVIEDEN